MEPVVTQIVQGPRQQLRVGVITLIPTHSVLDVSQQQAMGGSPYGNEIMERKLGTNLPGRHS